MSDRRTRGSGERTRNHHAHVESEGPTGRPRKVASSSQEGPALRYTAGDQPRIVLNYLILKSTRLFRENGQSEKRVLGSTFKTENIQGPGEKEQPAKEWPERQEKQQEPVASLEPGKSFKKAAG